MHVCVSGGGGGITETMNSLCEYSIMPDDVLLLTSGFTAVHAPESASHT